MIKKISIVVFSFLIFVSLFMFYSKTIFQDFDGDITLFTAPYSDTTKSVTIKKEESFFKMARYGESVKVNEILSVEEIFSHYKAEFVYNEKISDGENFYGFSSQIPYKTKINGKTINIHIFLSKKGYTVIGSPIIFCGY